MKPAEMLTWAVKMFGQNAIEPRERALRFVEESLELGQAVGLSRADAEALVERAYGRPPGDVAREVGQSKVTFELLARVLGIKPWDAYEAECKRILAIPKDEWERRHAAKKEKGITS